MDRIKILFREEYNRAIDFFDKGDYKEYFRHIRVAIEYFAKLLIYDVLSIKGESESVTEEIIQGRKWYDFKNNFAIILNPQPTTPEGKIFCTIAKNSFYHVYPQLRKNNNNNREQNRNKASIDNCLDSMMSYYNTASELALHTNPSSLDQKKQAESCVAFFEKAFDDLKSFISNETNTYLNQLDSAKDFEKVDRQIQAALNKNNEFTILDDITNHFTPSCDDYYVAILPENLTDNYGNKLSPDQLQTMFRLNWLFIVDMNPKTPDGLHDNVPNFKKSTIRIITNNLSEVTGTSNLTNWMFARGRNDLGVYDDKTTLKDTPQMFKKTFAKLARTGPTKDFIIFDFSENALKLTEKLYNKLEEVFGDWDSAANRCKIVVFTKDLEYKEILKERLEYTGIDVNFVGASFSDFLTYIYEKKPAAESSTTKLLIKGKSKDLTEAKERYHAAGINFYCPTNENQSEVAQWDFYSGAEITWEELENQCDVEREKYRVVRSRITDLLKTIRKTTVFTLRHRPGSGATTLARRLGYDITKEEEAGNLSCAVIDIKNCSNIRITEQYLRMLSEEIDNSPILSIVESKHIGREKFDELVKRMSDAGKKILFFYVEPFTGHFINKNDNLAFLDSDLRGAELVRFEEKYKLLGLDTKLLKSQKSIRNSLDVIDFPLMLKDNETSDNLASYVQEYMSVLPANLKKFCAFVGFVFKYSDLGVNQTLLKSIWKDAKHSTLMSYSIEETKAIKSLLVEESIDGKYTGIWRPRYNRFSTFLLSSYKSNWKAGLPELAKEFIDLCQNAGELGSDDKDMLYSIFVIRKNADYRALEDKDNIKNKFSLLIKDLNDIERAESLFSTLVEAFPNDAIFRGHFARFLYEKATMNKSISIDDRLFEDAQNQLDQAFDITQDDADLYHMQGMLLRRKITALSSFFKKEKKKKNIEEIDVNEIRTTLEDMVQEACVAFETSIELNHASPYGYAAECQLFKEAIELGQMLLGANDYSFCMTDYIFSKYTEDLGVKLDEFEQICYAFQDEGLTQIVNAFRIYWTIRAYHENLVGRNQESIDKYRRMYNGAQDDKKIFFGNLLLKSIVYSKTSKKDSRRNTRKAYRYLTKQERKEFEDILEYQKNKGDIKSFETYFMLKLYGNDEFSLDDAIDLLKEWEAQFENGRQNGWGYLNVCFYLAVCYSAKAIKQAKPNLELTSLAATYFRKSEEYAKSFDKGAVSPQCYLGERDDIHCIIDKSLIDSEGDTVTGVIHHINNNKGILKLSCGIEVTFNAKGFDILRDEGQTLRGLLGFSYSGPGLYEFRPENSSLDKDFVFEEIDETETTYEELEKDYLPAEDLVEEETDKTEEETTTPQIKVLGTIDVSDYKPYKGPKTSNKQINKSTEEGKTTGLHGYIEKNRKFVYKGREFSYLIDWHEGFAPDCAPSDYDYNEDEEVIFDIKNTTNRKTGAPLIVAINVRPACED